VIRAAVVGTGFGARVHVPALRAAGFEVAALVGRDLERTRRRADRLGIAVACTSLDEGARVAGIEAVTVATPPDAHEAVVLDAVRLGCHVLCEKPFGLDGAGAATMLRAAEQAGVVHLIGHEFRFAPERAVAARAIASGAIGEPRLGTFVQLVPLVADPAARVPEWWFDPARGGGWLGASGSHVVDQVRQWLGAIEWVAAALPAVSARAAAAAGAEDAFAVMAGLRRGCQVALVQSAGAWGPDATVTRVAGTEGTVWLDGGRAWLADADGERDLEVPADLALPPAPTPSDDPRHRFTHLELGPYTRLCERFRDAIGGGAPGGAATFVDGLANQRVLDAIRASARAGGARVVVASDGDGPDG
jgi:predicted dehydrogenase